MKNILKKSAILLATVTMVAGVSGCGKDYLDTTPTYMYSSSGVWNSAILARAALNGVYNSLYQKFCQNYTGGTLGIPSDAYSSVMDIDANWKGACLISPGNLTPSTGNLSTHFKYWYTIVYRANDVINNVGNVPDMEDAEKARIKAEATFLRCWAYYNLNVLWRGVPLYLENVNPQDATKGRSTEAEVWSQIEKDLTAAIPSLVDKTKGGEQVSKGAAYTLRGIVYQFLGDYSKALADFEQVGKLGYALFSPSAGAKGNTDYFQLFKPANEQCDEMVFAVACVEVSNQGNPRGINYGNRCTGGSAWNNYLPNPAFVERYEEADGKLFNWEDFIPGYTTMTPNKKSVYFLRDGLESGNGKFGAYDYKEKKQQMVEFGSDFTKYLDQGNEARIKKAYEQRDPRLCQSIITPYSEYYGNEAGVGNHQWILRWPYCLDAGEPYDIRTDTNSMWYYLWRKYVTENDECTTRWVYSENIILFRYAEVLLRQAECLIEIGGRNQEAIDLINQVRKRAGHVEIGKAGYNGPYSVSSSKEDLTKLVRNEMYVELGGEDSMYFNELRWGTWYHDKFNDLTLRAQNCPNDKNDNKTNGLMEMWGICKYNHIGIGTHEAVWPFPTKEREMNPNITQNPGWVD